MPKDNLQILIDEAESLANQASRDCITDRADEKLAEAIHALCAAMQLVKQEFQYYQKR